MVDLANKPRKGTISEEDISTLLQRYSATTVLSLLQEVAQVQNVNIDWNELVKKTTTGITNAREYQMLWRHLAYRDSLVELEDGVVPMDDDSDLEYELEAFPPVSADALAEAAACAKVLIAGSQSDTNLLNGSTVEAPLTINIPNGQSSRAAPDNSQLQGTNITIPVSVQKQPLPTVTSAEGFDANGSGSGNLPSRRKRKKWSEAEDLELIAAVQKCGEGNWANILKGDFKGDRTASQLSQRWTIIRKRRGNSTAGSGSQISEAQLAARAVSMALDSSLADKLKPSSSNGTAGTNTNPPAVEASPVGTQSQKQTRQDSAPTTLSKSRITLSKPSTKPALSPDALVKAAAVAAGARIATPSDAASLLKAAQAKHAIHIVPGGGSLAKSSVAVNANALPPNVHYIRTGLATTHSSYPPVSTNASRSGGSQQAQNNSLKPTAQIVQLNTTQAAPESNLPAEVSNVAASSPASDLINANENIDSSSCNPPKELVQQDKVPVSVSAPIERVQESQAVVPGDAPEERVLEGQAPISSSEKREQSLDQEMVDVPIEGREHQSEAAKTSEKGGGENQSAAEKTSENRRLDEKQEVLPGNSRDASDENSEVAN